MIGPLLDLLMALAMRAHAPVYKWFAGTEELEIPATMETTP